MLLANYLNDLYLGTNVFDWLEFVSEIWGPHRGIVEIFYVNIFMKIAASVV